MRVKGISVLLFLALTMLVPCLSDAAGPVHNFDCKNCHLTGLTYTQLGNNVCLVCHGATPAATETVLRGTRTSKAGFVTGDASAQYDNNLAPGAETSHNWAATSTNPAAGAAEPNRTLHPGFYSRYGSTVGKVACSRCHNPHGDSVANPKLLPLINSRSTTPMTANAMCIACHQDFAGAMSDPGNHGLLTHPLIESYETFASTNPDYKTGLPVYDPANPYATGVQLVGGAITCLTCHGLHATDSNAGTDDGFTSTNLGTGDGLLLRGDGLDFVNDTTGRATSFCSTCHVYDTMHGSSKTVGGDIGCLGCHGGHNYDSKNQPGNNGLTSLYMLPNNFTSVPTSDAQRSDMMGGTLPGVLDGLCERCHGHLENNFNTILPASGQDHTGAALPECISCHQSHGDGAYSKPVGCDGCHGWPPRTATEGGPSATGSAWDPLGTSYQYSVKSLTTNGNIDPLDESLTGHAKHAYAAGAGNYAYDCGQCHQGNNHNGDPIANPTFQDVFITATGLIATTGDGTQTTFAPAYAGATNVCSNLYCHSDGVTVRAGAALAPVTSGATPKAVPSWNKGVTTPTTTCASCHVTGTTGTSTVHTTHLGLVGLGVTCGTCHKDTSLDGATLVATAIGNGGIHVNGSVDVDFNTFAPAVFNSPLGTCSVYCHSNGITYVQQPDWDDVTTGDCGDCHGGRVGDVSTITSGAHTKHVVTLALACDKCHTHDGTSFSGDHINGVSPAVDLKADACAECHGAMPPSVGTGAGNDVYPTWAAGSPTVTCETCHAGTYIAKVSLTADPAVGGTGTYVDQSEYATGHGMATVAKACTECHNDAATGHFDGTNNNPRLKTDPKADGGAEAYATGAEAWCQDCHTASTSVHAGAANTCKSCHEPHGKGMAALGNTDAMLIVGKNFTDKTKRSSYVNQTTGFDGVCQICHTATSVFKNSGTNDNLTHNYGADADDKVCTDCHKHDATPAFKAGCTDCHGNATTGNYWPDSVTVGTDAKGNAYPNRLGAHAEHINAIAAQMTGGATLANKNLTCDYCHPGGGHSGDQLAAPADLMSGANKFKNILGVANVQTSSVTQSGGNVSCATVDCHYTTATGATDWYTAGSQADCNYCHTVADSPYAGGLPDAHAKHMSEIAGGGRDMVCTNCHTTAGSDAHQNGVIDFSTAAAPLEATLSIDTATTAGTKLGPKYGAAGAIAAEFSTCSNLECHGNFTGGDATNAPNWFNTDAEVGAGFGDGACGTCHGTNSAATPDNTGKHTVHLGSNTYVPGDCNDCHTKAVATHVYGTINLGGNATVASAPTCTNDCHTLDGLDNKISAVTSVATDDTDNPSWLSANTNKLGCEDCHDNSVLSWTGVSSAKLNRGWPPTNGEHTIHLSNSYVASDCTDCHSSNEVTHSPMNDTVEVDGGKMNTWTTPSCTNDCHTLKGLNNIAGGGDDASWTAIVDLGCADCHDNSLTGLKPLNTMAPTSGLHATTTAWNHQTLLGATSCTMCHTATPSGTHINTVWQNSATLGNFNFNAANIASYDHTNGCAASCHQDQGEWNREWWNVVDAIPQNTDNPGDAVCGNCHGDFSGWRFTAAATNTSHTNPYNQGGSNLDKMDQHDGCTTCHGWGSAPAIYNSAMSPSRGSANPGYFGHMDGRITLNGPDEALTIDSIAYTAQGAQYDDNTGGCAAACHSNALVMNSNSNWVSNYVDAGSGACDTCHSTNGVTHGDTSENLTVHNAHNANVLVDTNTNFDSAAISTWDNCDTCHPHSGAFAAGNKHNDGIVNFANKITATTYDYAKGASFGGSCGATNGCHDSDSGEWQSGDLSSFGDNGCADCHASTAGFFTKPNGWPQVQGMHESHVGNTAYVADNCVDCHNDNTSTHSTINNVVTAVGGAKLATFTTPNCTNSCHKVDATDDGWLAGALECTDCHSTTLALNGGGESDLSTSIGPNAGRHDEHMASAYGYACNSCHGHDGDLTAGLGTHVNGPLVTNITMAGQVTVSPIPADDTCTNNCHTVTDGADWTAGTLTNGIILACAECHGAAGKSLNQGPIAPTSGEHTPHLTSNSLTGTEANGEDCYACHESSITSAGELKNYRVDAANKHLDTLTTSVVYNSTFYYEGNPAGITGTGDAATCSNVRCHNGVTTPTWATADSISCGQCHNTDGTGPLPSDLTTGRSHADHANNDSTYTDCANCHVNVGDYTATGGTNHQNLVVEVAPFDGSSNAGTYTDSTVKGGVNWTAAGGLDDGTCANSCHGVGASPYWGNTNSVTCTTCHNDGANDGNILNAVPLATGTIHDTHTGANNAYVTDDCVACHGAGSDSTGYAANVNHINGALGSGATYNSATITSYDFATNQTCVNSCHAVVDGRDWTSATALACDDCHGAPAKSLYRNRAGGSHAAHYNTVVMPASGDIIRTGNNDSAEYNFGCAECHSGIHLNGLVGMNPAAAFNSLNSTCGTNACHENGLGGPPLTTPTWGTAFTGDSCNDCHGNSPTTNAHEVHAVGIHFGELYNKTDGGLLTTVTTDSTLGEVDHGDGSSTTISCNVCHNNTVITGRNRLGSACFSCHATDTDIAANNIAIADYKVHVNGVTNVAILGTIKSKAQLRDNLADADANGTSLLSAIWNRLTGYKSAANSVDTSLVTADAFGTAGANTCSNIACHNGNDAVWAAPQNDCMACHKSLPK